MTPEKPHTPLTLEYFPEPLEGDNGETKPIIVVEPSMPHPGRIFVGVHPLANHSGVERAGCHLLPDDARRLMNHLAKLLMEEPDGGEIDWQARIQAAAERAEAQRPRGRSFKLNLPVKFRFEFQIGNVVGIIGTENG